MREFKTKHPKRYFKFQSIEAATRCIDEPGFEAVASPSGLCDDAHCTVHEVSAATRRIDEPGFEA